MRFYRSYRNRRSYGKRRFSRRYTKRTYRKRFTRRGAFGTPKGTKVLYAKRTLTTSFTYAALVSTLPAFYVHQGNLTQLPNYTEFTNLFDEYKISAMKITWFSPYNEVTSVNSQQVRLHTATDTDDTALPSSIDTLRQKPSYKDVQLSSAFIRNGKISRFFKVRHFIAGAATEGAVGYGNIPASKWLSCTNAPAIQHFGLKWAISCNSSNGSLTTPDDTFTMPVEVTYYMKFRGMT